MQIKTSLKQLFDLFAAAFKDEEVPEIYRALSRTLMILTAHVGQIRDRVITLEKLVAELTALTAAQKPVAAAAAPTGDVPAAPVTPEEQAEDPEEVLLAQIQKDNDEALAAEMAKTVTPLRKPASVPTNTPIVVGDAS